MLLDKKTVDEAIKLIEASDNDYALKNLKCLHHHCIDEQLKKVFGNPVIGNEKSILFGFPVIENKAIPDGEIWMIGKNGELLKRFKI